MCSLADVNLELAEPTATSAQRSAVHGSYGYKWKSNSCWIDSSMELLARALLSAVPPAERTRFHKIVAKSKDAPLYKVALHLKARQQWWKADGRGWNETDTGVQHLQKGQADLLSLVRTKAYGFVRHTDGTGDPRALLNKLYTVQ